MYSSWNLSGFKSINPVFQVSAEEDTMDLCGRLLVLKQPDVQDHAKSHEEPGTLFTLPNRAVHRLNTEVFLPISPFDDLSEFHSLHINNLGENEP